MNYHHMIEPYLYGSLSPEDEIAFEKQLMRDPALVEATGRRLNARETLSGFPSFQARPVSRRRPAAMRSLLLLMLAATLAGLLFWKMQLSEATADALPAPVNTPVSQSGILSE